MTYKIKGAYRWALSILFAPLVRNETYSAASETCGYSGWSELPVIGVIAFRRDDGTQQFVW